MPISGPPLENYCWERHRHRKNSPSFSASLLDAITRSIDASDSAAAAAGGEQYRRRRLAGGVPDPIPPVTANTSSSSSSSFFSSDTDTPVRIRPIRTGPVPTRSDRIQADPPRNQTQTKNQDLTSIKKKLRDLRRSAGPVSPGARLAGFLSSLFNPNAGNPKKPKIAAAKEHASSLCSRSCLSKTPSKNGSGAAAAKRSVRFSPVGVVVGEDCRPCGEKLVFAGGGCGGGAPMDFPVKKGVRGGLAMKEDCESDSSEDLFELENLGGVANKSNGKNFRDELPVYETTSLGINRAIARGLVV